MKLPISWLNEYVDTSNIDLETLKAKLFDIGFEVEEVINIGREIDKVVTGQITQIEKHPDSDHLQICQLNCGSFGSQIQIVTGAQNVFEGAIVPVALDGSSLAGGVKIKNGKLRGVPSNGMLCSGEELGIGEDFFDGAGVDGILILDKNTPIGEDIKKIVGLDDIVFDLSITANRPDCQSIYGIAREVAAIFNLPLKPIETEIVDAQPSTKTLKVSVNAPKDCVRYIGAVVEGVRISTSPAKLRRKLLLCDINPKNIIVDITNYVLLELGQPMHAFNYANVAGGEIVVRKAQAGEKIQTLDEKTYELNTQDLVICDAQKPVALAGIMGGANSQITDDTQTLVFETAVFMREGIRKTSRRLGLSSDSSRRYEKGVDAYTAEFASARALNLIQTYNAGTVTNLVIDVLNTKIENKTVVTTARQINNLLGIEVPAETMLDILKRLQFDAKLDGETLTATAPLFRNDISTYQDLTEEIVRMYGYDKITSRLIENAQVTSGGYTAEQKSINAGKAVLVGQGAFEIKTYSFISPKDLDKIKLPSDADERQAIEIINPLNEDYSIMRKTLLPSMLNVVEHNVKHGTDSAKLFELASTYVAKELPIKDFPAEISKLMLAVFGSNNDFFTAKGLLELFAKRYNANLEFEAFEPNHAPVFLHPYQSAKVILNGETLGYIGKVAYEVLENYDITQPVYVAEIEVEKIYACGQDHYKIKAVSKFPSIVRDLSFVAPKTLVSGEIEKAIKSASKTLSHVTLFDVYEGVQVGEGNKSMTYRLTFEPNGDTELSHEEVDKQIKRILGSLKFQLGLEIRQ